MNKDEVVLTVFTPTYNQENYIEKCIEGIVTQKTNFKFNLVISDDCSTDSTRNIIKKYEEKYPDIVKCIYREKNLGPMNNFIYSLNDIHTKYVALCDGDDFWTDKNKLQTQYDFLEKNHKYSLCFHQTEIFYDDHSHDSIIHPINQKKTIELDDILNENMIVANSVLYRWKYQKKDSLIKEFPKNIVPGDYFINIMHISTGKGYFIEKVMSKYRKQPNGMWYLQSNPNTQDLFYLKYGKKYLRFYKSVEKILGLSKERLSPQKDWIICNKIRAYTKKRKFWSLKILFYKEYKNCKTTFNNVFTEFNKKDKIYYCLSVNIFYSLCIIMKKIYYKLKYMKSSL